MNCPTSLTVVAWVAVGRSTGMPDWSRGVITMNTTSRTNTTSINGVTLISAMGPFLPLPSDAPIGYFAAAVTSSWRSFSAQSMKSASDDDSSSVTFSMRLLK